MSFPIELRSSHGDGVPPLDQLLLIKDPAEHLLHMSLPLFQISCSTSPALVWLDTESVQKAGVILEYRKKHEPWASEKGLGLLNTLANIVQSRASTCGHPGPGGPIPNELGCHRAGLPTYGPTCRPSLPPTHSIAWWL